MVSADAWIPLQASSVRGDELVARRIDARSAPDFLCALGSNSLRHFLVITRGPVAGLSDDRSRGIRVNVRDLSVAGEPSQSYIDIECADPGAHELFDLFGSDLGTALAASPSKPVEVVKKVLAKWRRFWSDLPRSLLSSEQLLGLFGELWFLHLWLAPAVGYDIALRAWRGPFGARHDYESDRSGVEVKVTSSRQSRIHRVNGIDQLEPPLEGRLFLFSLRVLNERSATNSLPMLLDAVRHAVVSDADSAALLDNALARLGYSDAFRDYYDQLKLRVVDNFLFEIDSRFPTLTRARLVGGALFPGVSAVSYEIDLDPLTANAIAAIPVDGLSVLRQLRWS